MNAEGAVVTVDAGNDVVADGDEDFFFATHDAQYGLVGVFKHFLYDAGIAECFIKDAPTFDLVVVKAVS